jgi:hypothetical protein
MKARYMHAASQRKKRKKLIFQQLFVLFGGPEEFLNGLIEYVKRNVPVRYCIFSATKCTFFHLIYFLSPKVFISRLDPYLHPDPQRCILSIRNWYPSLRNKPDPPTTFLDIQLPVFIRFYLYIFSLSPSLRVPPNHLDLDPYSINK